MGRGPLENNDYASLKIHLSAVVFLERLCPLFHISFSPRRDIASSSIFVIFWSPWADVHPPSLPLSLPLSHSSTP